jgi:aspartate dehydrogenase
MTVFNQPSDGFTIGLIGHGAIGKAVAEAIVGGRAGRCRLVKVLRRKDAAPSADYPVTHRPEEFLADSYDLVIEAAGQEALRELGEQILNAGADLLISSIGAFSDEGLLGTLIEGAIRNRVRLLLSGGALPAVDWMSAVSGGGPCMVSIRQEKPARSWQGTPAEELIDLSSVRGTERFFEGSARESAKRFPKSSNITAMLGLSTAGLDDTRVELVADAAAQMMRTEIVFQSAVGSLEVIWQGTPSAANPRTSTDVAFTIIKALRNLTSPVYFGV